jgi:DNA (cytosine-5)-methyltransferase 1
MNGGLEVKLALNHWKLAIETHNTNFPETIHHCTDISACDPRRYPSTDILITSPECTNHSLAKGVKIAKKQMELFDSGKLDAAAERSRATMWDVPRFAEYHKYRCIIVENVVDARKWIMFDAWIHAMHLLGYNHKCVYLNSMHCHPTPQSRDRMYVVFWQKGNKAPMLDYQPLAHCPQCSKDVHAVQVWKDRSKPFGKFKTQYVYRCPSCSCKVEPYYYAAANCIDWSDVGTRIGDRKLKQFRNKKTGKISSYKGETMLPLAPNTLERIDFGLEKYGKHPFQVVNYSPGYSKSLLDTTASITTSDHHGILQPFLIDDKQNSGVNFRVRGTMDNTVNTVHTDPRLKIVMPFIIKGEHSQNLKNAVPISGPIQTHTTRQSMAVITPFIVENKGQSKAKAITDPAGALTTKPHLGIVTDEVWKSFISYYYGNTQVSNITDALGSATTKDRHQLITYKEPKLEDCYYRMLKPPEVKVAMAFDGDYVVLGSGKDQVKQLGNAVTPPAMEYLLEQCIESLK